MVKPLYRRVLLKLSGEVLTGDSSKHGVNQPFNPVDQATLQRLVSEIGDVVKSGVQVAIVIGGGNICRGENWLSLGIDRVTADQIGMLATVMNSLLLRDALISSGQMATVLSAVPMLPLASGFQRYTAIELLEKNHVVICAAGTGNPLVTTDSAASLRGIELQVDVVLKATQVDGVYSADPKKDPSAKRYQNISYQQAIDEDLKVMDITAFQQCRDHNMPLRVFDVTQPGSLKRVIFSTDEGTLISS